MAAAWRNFKTQTKEKRTTKKKYDGASSILHGEEIIVQRLSSDVSGKAQKYSRIGPREFVPFEFEDVTLENIKLACQNYFSPRISSDMICDVLAGEQSQT